LEQCVPDLLSSEAALTYWDKRHQAQDRYRAGGDIGLDEGGNAIFYAIRLGQLLELVGSAVAPAASPSLLDAGCGNGWFSRALAQCGYLVEGIDASPSAIEIARAAGGGPQYTVSTLAEFMPRQPYDVVASIDVLFHLTNDEDWAASVANLGDCVRLGGALVIADDNIQERRSSGTYIVYRPIAGYCDILGARGLTYRGFRPYGFRHNQIGLHLFTRVG
jgi:2-polyprenyl-3-methyl-5-hydroxy-6-metoxy-1,4-benzoquinol methylase